MNHKYSGRPENSTRAYPRKKSLYDAFPTLPEFPKHLNHEGPRSNREEVAWSTWIKTATQAIRQLRPRGLAGTGIEPEWIAPIFGVSDLLVSVDSVESD